MSIEATTGLGSEDLDTLIAELSHYDDEELELALAGLPESVVAALLEGLSDVSVHSAQLPKTPIAQAFESDDGYRSRPHLNYLSDRLAQAVIDVENGKDRRLLISMPPRTGKSQLTSVYFPLWLLRRHPEWKIGMISHSDSLAIGWGREIRRQLEENREEYGISIAKDAGAASHWQTTRHGSVTARSAPGQSITGLGFKVLLIDDAVRDFASAHSKTARENLWDWWRVNASTRLEPPSLVVVIGTRWHEDDLIGRLLSKEYEGDPDEWEVISFPAIAEEGDVLGRVPGEPLLSPIVANETEDQALERWAATKSTVGAYGWAALYQQRPAPAEGAIFNAEWWRYWTLDPNKVTHGPDGKPDGKVILLPQIEHGKWVDSWDCTFKATASSDFVVGQRWVRVGAYRFLIAQKRGRWGFTETLEQMESWVDSPANPSHPIDNPYGRLVHRRVVEEKANGAALIEVMREKVAGIKPINPQWGKEVRARGVTPEIESGHCYLPHPADPGNEWVNDLLSELRNFPNDVHDDQVDTLTQALVELRDAGTGRVTVPKNRTPSTVMQMPRRGGSSRVAAAHTQRTRRY